VRLRGLGSEVNNLARGEVVIHELLCADTLDVLL
jgi:hypothetical protein